MRAWEAEQDPHELVRWRRLRRARRKTRKDKRIAKGIAFPSPPNPYNIFVRQVWQAPDDFGLDLEGQRAVSAIRQIGQKWSSMTLGEKEVSRLSPALDESSDVRVT